MSEKQSSLRPGQRRPVEAIDPATALSAEEARLLEQMRGGEPDAGHRFTREYYPAVYRYLMFLTGRPDVAEDLTQETFVQAWSHLDSFEGRSPLRAWLHRIAHREFLQFLRRRRDERSLDETGELPAPMAESWRDSVELRAVLRELPVQEREMLALHYLEGYSIAEVAAILGLPANRVKFRLLEGRAHLRTVLGEGDLPFLNEAPAAGLRRWTWLPLEELSALEARLSLDERAWLNPLIEPDEPIQDPSQAELTEDRLRERRHAARRARRVHPRPHQPPQHPHNSSW